MKYMSLIFKLATLAVKKYLFLHALRTNKASKGFQIIECLGNEFTIPIHCQSLYIEYDKVAALDNFFQ